ncbi:hypothetical protein HPB50_005898 [Hyalomma asiaticum]|uniref:Uncharacterized protein n=1 Tax=Hyalomma asiaticum TaxID=266040 RepID=A0ACB7T8L6_HYAAI|nr:hypothetical protein HPB50_005898 [Hyalomma asiaticum]
MNLKDTHVGHGYRKSLTAVVVLSPVLIFVFLIAVLVLKHNSGLRRIKLFHIADDLKKSCRNWQQGGRRAGLPACCGADVTRHGLPRRPVPRAGSIHVRQVAQLEPVSEHISTALLADVGYCELKLIIKESTENLTAVIHESLLYLLNNLHLYGHEEGSMAVFYRSCRSFLLSRCGRTVSAGDVISASGLKRRLDSVDETAGTQGLLDFVVKASMETGLSSIVSVSSRAGRVYVDVGQSLQSTLSSANVVVYLNATLRELDVGNGSLASLLYLEHAVHSCVAEADRTERFLNVALGMLGEGSFGASFVNALNKAAPADVPVYSAESLVAVRCLPEIRATLATLAAASLHRAYVYSAMVLLAQVMKYAYIFRCGSAAAHQVTKNCVKITGQHFKALFPPWVAKKVLGDAVLAAFHAMTRVLLEAVVRSATAKELNVTESDFNDLKVVVVGEPNATTWLPSSTTAAVLNHYGDRFLLNVVRASRDGVGVNYEEHAVERQLGGRVVVEDSDDYSAILVPADFLVADMMYTSAGPEVNLPTVGVWLLVQWIKAAVYNKAMQQTAASSGKGHHNGRPVASSKSSTEGKTEIAERASLVRYKAWSTKAVSNGTSDLRRGSRGTKATRKAGSRTSGLANSSVRAASEADVVTAVNGKIECLRQEASNALGRNVSFEEAESLFYVNWAVDAALSATVTERRGTAAGSWLQEHRVTQMFFMRFCHSVCGDEEMMDACRFQAMRNPEVSLAFQCSVAQVVKCPS